MRFFILFLFIFSSLFSIDPSTPEEIANLNSSPSAIAGGYINVITGDFAYHKTDLTITGAVPLTLDRFFSSREKRDHDQKWEIFNHHRATKSGDTLYIQEPSGVSIPYTKISKGQYRPKREFFQKRDNVSHSSQPQVESS